jgi:hypothetical protein
VKRSKCCQPDSSDVSPDGGTCYPGAGGPGSGGSGGPGLCNDPVVVGSLASYEAETDLSVRLSSGATFDLKRYYVSRADGWLRGASQTEPGEMAFLPAPYGYSPRVKKSLEWWNNLYSFVYVSNRTGQWMVRNPYGELLTYNACTGTPCFATPVASTIETQMQLQYANITGADGGVSTGYVLYEPSGRRHEYTAFWRPPASYTPDRYFLSRTSDQVGRTIARVNYGPPGGLTGCPGGLTDGGYGPPYVSTVQVGEPGGVSLAFNYAKLPSGNGEVPSECVLSRVDVLESTGLQPAVGYSYAADGGYAFTGREAVMAPCHC